MGCCNCETSTSALCPKGGTYRQWICSEFSCSRLWLYHGDWRVFTYSPWLPYKIQYQWIFLLYRWVAALFFTAVTIASAVIRSTEGDMTNEGAKWLLFISNWSIVVLASYFLWAAVATTFKILWVHGCLCDNSKVDASKEYHDFNDVPSVPACCAATCSCSGEGPSWYQKVQWVLFYVAVSATVVVTIIFWTLVYDSANSVDFITVCVHGLNVLFAIVDVLFSGTPMRILHFYFATIYGIIYVVFQRIYFEITKNPIYNPLNYGENEGRATGYAIGLVFAFLGGHLLFYFVYLLRVLITTALFKCRRDTTEV